MTDIVARVVSSGEQGSEPWDALAPDGAPGRDHIRDRVDARHGRVDRVQTDIAFEQWVYR